VAPCKIMILGAGQYQLPLIQAAREMGHHSVVVGRDDGSPGIAMADTFVPLDFCDTPRVLEAARREGIHGICSASSDLPMKTIGAVVDALGLPGIGSDIVRRTTIKTEMKAAFHAHGVPTAAHRTVRSAEEATAAAQEIGYPVMVKPIDSMGGHGVARVDSPEALGPAWQAAEDATSSNSVIVEKYLEGPEFGIQALIHEGELLYAVPTRKILTADGRRIPLGHVFCPDVATMGMSREGLRDLAARSFHSLGVASAHATIDCIRTEDGLYVLELGARLGATCLPECTEVYTGMKVFEQALRLALGEPPEVKVTQHQPTAARYIVSDRSGTLGECRVPPGVESAEDVVRFTLYAKPGDHVDAFSYAGDRIGEAIVTADSPAAAEKRVVDICESVEVVVEA